MFCFACLIYTVRALLIQEMVFNMFCSTLSISPDPVQFQAFTAHQSTLFNHLIPHTLMALGT